MASISDLSIVNSNTAPAAAVAHGFERTLCSPELCGSENLTVFRRTVSAGRSFALEAGERYHLLYLMQDAPGGSIDYAGNTQATVEGAGAMLVPGESLQITAGEADVEVLHMIVPQPPAGVDAGLDGGPGYVFNRDTLRRLSDASGGRVRRFCAESSVRLQDGSRLTQTNAIQAGEMHYRAGGSSPYHQHFGTDANPRGPDHVYMTFKGNGVVEVEGEMQEIEPGTLVYFPPGIPHRLRAHGGTLDYFEIQAWRSFRTNILSEEALGLRWYYDPESPGAEPPEWNQT